VIVENCIIENTAAYGIWVEGELWGPDMPVIRNNLIRHTSFGISCGGSFARLTPLFEGNVVTDCSVGAEAYQSAPRFEGNSFTHCRFNGMRFLSSGGVCNSNVIAFNGEVAEFDCGGVWVGGSTGPEGLFFNDGDLQSANNFYGNVGHDIYFDPGQIEASVYASGNYWGSECPAFSDRLRGDVSYSPWTDSAHAKLIYPKDCDHATEPTTWGAIKAMFR
jgi:hypothetical protein